jgi:hypothetical protein
MILTTIPDSDLRLLPRLTQTNHLANHLRLQVIVMVLALQSEIMFPLLHASLHLPGAI